MRSARTNQRRLRIGAIAVAIAAIGLATLLSDTFLMSPTGPLALVEPDAGRPQARAEGMVEITDECVSLVHPSGTRSLIIWFRGEAVWDATDRTVRITTPEGHTLTLQDGDSVVLTGGGGPAATLESAGSWVRRPGAACNPPQWFLSVDVQRAAPGGDQPT